MMVILAVAPLLVRIQELEVEELEVAAPQEAAEQEQNATVPSLTARAKASLLEKKNFY